jgi:hypothetical protein
MQAAVDALLTTETVEAAAGMAGVCASTLYRWCRVPEFREALRMARREAFVEAIGDLQRAAKRAVRTLLKNAECGTLAIENDAAKAILDRAMRGTEIIDLAAEVAELRRIIEADRKARRQTARYDGLPNGNGRPYP